MVIVRRWGGWWGGDGGLALNACKVSVGEADAEKVEDANNMT